jgi:uncharacterized membrane protein YesL
MQGVRAREAFRTFWKALGNLWDESILLALMNAVTVLPVLGVIASVFVLVGALEVVDGAFRVANVLGIILCILLAIPAFGFPPALAALWHVANRVADGKSIHWRDYFDGFRRYFWMGWSMALLNVVVSALVLVNVVAYGPSNPFGLPFDLGANVTGIVRGVFVVVGVLWLVFQMYPMAMLLEQEDQRLRLALRNSFFVFIASPGFALVMALLLLLVIAISLFLPLLLLAFTFSLIAVVCNQAVKRLLVPVREQMKAQAESGEEAADGT